MADFPCLPYHIYGYNLSHQAHKDHNHTYDARQKKVISYMHSTFAAHSLEPSLVIVRIGLLCIVTRAQDEGDVMVSTGRHVGLRRIL